MVWTLGDFVHAEESIVGDRALVRFYPSEVAGSPPRFLTERGLRCAARFVALEQLDIVPSAPLDEQAIRTALEQRIAQDILLTIPISSSTERKDLSSLLQTMQAEWVERLGGKERVQRVMQAEMIGPQEMSRIVEAKYRTAQRIDQLFEPILQLSEDDWREAFRTMPHPYRKRASADALLFFQAWYIDQKVRSWESDFFQSIRSRVRMVWIDQDP